jgi:predicted unusual protein kinase regulating ubiquinone biosynthesis (AarF/ABC1/UbiB family)
MEYLAGDKITDSEKWLPRNNDPLVIAREIIEIYMEQFINMRLIHFDPHPGNILINENNSFVLLDFGMAGQITGKVNKGIKDGLKAFIEKDYIRIIEILDELGFIRKGIKKNSLLSIMEYFFDEIIYTVKLEKESMQSIDLSPIVDDLVELVYSQPFNLPIEWAYIGRTIGVLTGIISSLNPEINLYQEFSPYAEKLLKLNLDEILSDGSDIIKHNAQLLYNLPRKANNLIDDLERGTLKVKVDFEEVDEKIDELKGIVVRTIIMGAAFFSAFGAFVFYSLDKFEEMLILGGFSFVTFIFSMRYKKISQKEFIKRNITKM